ncbi:MAG: hypothetical protein KFH98_09705 [Gemmatimonadetes bacterium]|nr:hypothetical protein [Gemmatimonadota bacterium]
MMTRTNVLRVCIAAAMFAGATGEVNGQVPWESPQLLAPATASGVSLMYVDYGLRPNDGTGMLLMWRRADAPRGFGLRIAGTLPQENDIRLSGGIDIAVPMYEHSVTFPLDVVWTSGFGASYGDYYSAGLPVGVAAGRVFTGDNVWFQPYTSARVVLEGYFGADRPDESFGLALAADVGIDASLHRSRVIILRTAMSLGDRRALSVGLQLSPGAAATQRTAGM